jgi:ArsR family transcriptional regulator
MLFVMKRPTDPDHLLLHGAADPTRLAILRQLAAADGVCACEFTECCGVTQPTVSHHLKVLRDSGWVRTERRGSFIWYFLRREAVARFQELAGQLSPQIAAPSASVPPRALPVIQPLA